MVNNKSNFYSDIIFIVKNEKNNIYNFMERNGTMSKSLSIINDFRSSVFYLIKSYSI